MKESLRNQPPQSQPTVTQISYKEGKGGKRQRLGQHSFQEEKISFLSEEGIEIMDLQAVKGLCMKRFKGDLQTKGLEYSQMKSGQQLGIGEAVIELVEIGKSCHSHECPAYKQGASCVMLHETMFGRVIVPGTITVNDRIEVL